MKSDLFRVLILLICVTETLAWIRFRHPPSRRNFVQQTPIETLQKCDITKDAFCKICGEGNASTSDIPVTNYTIIDRNTRILAIEVAFQVGLDGYLEFRLCNVTENATMDAIVCRDITPLLIGASERWYPNPDQTYAQSRLRLPAELECVRCVLQVKYTPGDQSIMKNLRFYDCALLNISRPNMDITNVITTRTVVTNTNVRLVPGQVINTGAINSQTTGQITNGVVNNQATNTTTVTKNVINVSSQGGTKPIRSFPSDHAILEEDQMFSHENALNGNGMFVQNNERRQFGNFGFNSGTGVVPSRETDQGSNVNLRHSLTETSVASGRNAPVVGLMTGGGMVHRFSTITGTVSNSTNTAGIQSGGVIPNTINTATNTQGQGGLDSTGSTVEEGFATGANDGVRVVTNVEKMNVLRINVNDGAVSDGVANNAGNIVNTIGRATVSNSNLQTGSSGALNDGITTKTRDTLNVLRINFVSGNEGAAVSDNIANNRTANVVNTIDRTEMLNSNQQEGVTGVISDQTANNRVMNVNVVNRIDRTMVTGSGQQEDAVADSTGSSFLQNEMARELNSGVAGITGVAGQDIVTNVREQSSDRPSGTVDISTTVVRTTNTGNVKLGTVGVINNDLAFTEVNNAANWDNAALSSDQTSRTDTTRSKSGSLLIDNSNTQTTRDINSEIKTNSISTNQAFGETVNNGGIAINRTFVDTTWNIIPDTTSASLITVEGNRMTNNANVVNTVEQTNILTEQPGNTLIRNNTSHTSLFGLSLGNNIGIRNSTSYNGNMINYNNTLHGYNETLGTYNNDMNLNGTDTVFNTQETLINTNTAATLNIENPVTTIEGSSIYLGDISSLNSGGNTIDPTVRTVTVPGIVTNGVNDLSGNRFGIIVNTNNVNTEVLTRDTTPVVDGKINTGTVIVNRTHVSADVNKNKMTNTMNAVNPLEHNTINIGELGNTVIKGNTNENRFGIVTNDMNGFNDGAIVGNRETNRFGIITNDISGSTDGVIVGSRETTVREVNVPSVATGTNSIIGETVNDNSAVIINRTFVDTSLNGEQNFDTGVNFVDENKMTNLNVVDSVERNNINTRISDNSLSTGNANEFTNQNRFGIVTNINSGFTDKAMVGNNQVDTVRETVVKEVNLPPIIPSISDLAMTNVATKEEVINQFNKQDIDPRGINIDINFRQQGVSQTSNNVIANIASTDNTDVGLEQQVIAVPQKLSIFPVPMIPERNETKLVASSNKFIVRRQNTHDSDTVNTGREFGIDANYSDGSMTQGASISKNRIIQLDSKSNNVISSNTGPVSLIHTLIQQTQKPGDNVSNINQITNGLTREVQTQSQRDSSSNVLTLDNTFNINQNVGFEFPADGDVNNYLGQTKQTATPIVTERTDTSQGDHSLNILNVDNNLNINQNVGQATVISTPIVNQRRETTLNIVSGTETQSTIRPINEVVITNTGDASVFGSGVQIDRVNNNIQQGASNGVVKTLVTTEKRVDVPVSESNTVQLGHDVTNRLSDSHTNVNTMFDGQSFFTDGNNVDKFGGVPIAISGRDEAILQNTGDTNHLASDRATLTNSKQTWSASDSNIGNSFDSTNALGVVVLDANMDSSVGHGVSDRNFGHLSTDKLSVINSKQIIKTADESIRQVGNMITTQIKPTDKSTAIGNNVVWQVMDVGANKQTQTVNQQSFPDEIRSTSAIIAKDRLETQTVNQQSVPDEIRSSSPRIAKDYLEMMVNGDATLNNIHTSRTISTKAIQSLDGVPDVMPPIDVKVETTRTTNFIRNSNNILGNTQQSSTSMNNNGGSYIINNLLHRTDDNTNNAMKGNNAQTLTGTAQLAGSTLWDINRNKTDIGKNSRTQSSTTVLRKTSSNDGILSTSMDRTSNDFSVQQSNVDQLPNYRTVIYDKPRAHVIGSRDGRKINSQVVRTLQALNLELSAIEGNSDSRNGATLIDRTNIETTNVNTGASDVNNGRGAIGLDGSIVTSNNLVGRVASNGKTVIGGANKDITMNINTGTSASNNGGRVVGIDGSLVTSNKLVGRVTSNGNSISGGAIKVKTTNINTGGSSTNNGRDSIGIVSSKKIIGRVTSNGQTTFSPTSVVETTNLHTGAATTNIGREINAATDGPIVRSNTVVGSGISTVRNDNTQHSSYPLFRVHESMLKLPQHVQGSIESNMFGSFGLRGDRGQRGANNHMIVENAIRNNRLNTVTNNVIDRLQNRENNRATNTVTVDRNDIVATTNNLNTERDNTNQRVGVITNRAVETKYNTASVNDQSGHNIQTTNIKRFGLGIHDISIPRASEGVFQSVINVTRPKHDTADLFGALANAFANVSKQTSNSGTVGAVNTDQSITISGTGTLNTVREETNSNLGGGTGQLGDNRFQQTAIGLEAPVVNQAVARSAPLPNSPWSGSSIDLSHHNDTFLPRGSTRFENRIGLQHTIGNGQIGLRPEMRQFQITNEIPTANNVAIEGKYFIGQMKRNELGQFEPVYTATTIGANRADVSERNVKNLNANFETTSKAAVDKANADVNRAVVADRKVIISNAVVEIPSAINRGNVDANRAVVSTRKVKILNATVQTPSDAAVRRANVDANRAVVSTRKVKILNATVQTPSNAAVRRVDVSTRKVKILNATVETPSDRAVSRMIVGHNTKGASNKFDASSNSIGSSNKIHISSNNIGTSNKIDLSSNNIGTSNKIDISSNNIGTSNKFGFTSNSIGTSNKIGAATNIHINPIVGAKQAVDTNIVRASGEKRTTSMGTGSQATNHVFFNQADLLNTFGIDVNIGNEQQNAALTQESSSLFAPALNNETDGEIITVSCPGDTIYVCEAVGESKQVPGMVWWCYSHCKNGFCPFDKCSCRCVNSDNAMKLEQERIVREDPTTSNSMVKNKRLKTVVTLTLNGSEKTTVPVEKSEVRSTKTNVIVPLRDSTVAGRRLIKNNGVNIESNNRLNENVQTILNNLANNNNIVSNRREALSVRTTRQGDAPANNNNIVSNSREALSVRTTRQGDAPANNNNIVSNRREALSVRTTRQGDAPANNNNIVSNRREALSVRTTRQGDAPANNNNIVSNRREALSVRTARQGDAPVNNNNIVSNRREALSVRTTRQGDAPVNNNNIVSNRREALSVRTTRQGDAPVNNNNIVSNRREGLSVRTTQQGEAPIDVSVGNTVVKKSTTVIVDDTVHGGLMPRAPIFGSGFSDIGTQQGASEGRLIQGAAEGRLIQGNTVVVADRSIYTLVCKGINGFVDTPGIADWCAAMCTDAVCPTDICRCS